MDTKPLIVILCPYPFNEAPSQRFRFEQQYSHLKTHFKIVQLSFWSQKTNLILYQKGELFQKIIGLLSGLIGRFFHLFTIVNADIVLIHREVIPVGSLFFEWYISKILHKKIIFDFDDAIWKLDTSDSNKSLEWLKNPNKFSKIISLSNSVISGNNYLSNYAKKYNYNTTTIPSTIDISYHKPIKNRKKKEKICIGWTGSKTTIKHFNMLLPVLEKVKNKYSSQIYFKLIGDEHYKSKEIELQGTKWYLPSEIDDLQEIDIGIMPLPDDEWANGKCGFKGLQYMALEIPTIMSPIGVNTEIIEHTKNGFLADSNEDWIKYLSLLIEQKELRTCIGKEGRQTVINRYSVKSQKENYLSALNELISE